MIATQTGPAALRAMEADRGEPHDDWPFDWPRPPMPDLHARLGRPARCTRCRKRRHCARSEHWTRSGIRRALLCWTCTLLHGVSVNDDDGRDNREETDLYCTGSPRFGCGMDEDPDGRGTRTMPSMGAGRCSCCGGLDPWDDVALPPGATCPLCDQPRPVDRAWRPVGPCPSCLDNPEPS